MPLFTYRYGEAAELAGLRLGTTRHLPRGVKREDYARLGYFDVWLPQLAPSVPLLRQFRDGKLSYERLMTQYRRELAKGEPLQIVRFVAAVAQRQVVHVGCFCEDRSRCHRSVLAELLASAGAPLGQPIEAPARSFARPACSMPEIED